jgi:hypothetical protein
MGLDVKMLDVGGACWCLLSAFVFLPACSVSLSARNITSHSFQSMRLPVCLSAWRVGAFSFCGLPTYLAT